MKRKLIIVGAGMAAARLLYELVAREHNYDIEVIGEEPYPSYNRILLSGLLSDEGAEDNIELHKSSWYGKHGIKITTNEKVKRINIEAKTLTTDKRSTLPYDKIVIATGSVPFIPPITGVDAHPVFSFRNRRDLHQIKSCAQKGLHAVIIGGGLLGLEAANGLLNLGMQVTVINREAWLMPRQLDQPAAAMLQCALEKKSMEFNLGITVSSIEANSGKVTGVTLDSGEKLAANMVLLTTGVIPNTELARRSGIACDKGIIVDQKLATDCAGVFALGECCQIAKQVFGLVAPVYQQAAVLAQQLTSQGNQVYEHREATTQLKVAGITVASGGLLPFPEHAKSQILTDRKNNVYRRLVFDKTRLIGFVLIGNAQHKSRYESSLDSGERLAGENSSYMFAATPSMHESDIGGNSPGPTSTG